MTLETCSRKRFLEEMPVKDRPMKEGTENVGELSDCITGQLCKVGKRSGDRECCAAVQFQERTCQLTEKSLSPRHPSEECWG